MDGLFIGVLTGIVIAFIVYKFIRMRSKSQSPSKGGGGGGASPDFPSNEEIKNEK